MRFPSCLIFISCFCIACAAYAANQQPFEPHIVEPAKQTWLWREVEELQDQGFYAMAKGPRGHVYFATEQGLFEYDGYHFIKLIGTEGLRTKYVMALFVSSQRNIYVHTEDGLYALNEDHWQLIFESKSSYLSSRSFDEDSKGNIWVRVSEGIVKINGFNAEMSMDFARLPLGIAVGENDTLWVTFFDETMVYECTTVEREMRLRERCKRHKPQVTAPEVYRRYMPYVDSKGNIWVIDRHPHSGVLQYDSRQKKWLHHEINFAHSSIIETYDGVIFLASDRLLHRFANGVWDEIKIADIQIDLTNISLIETKDGRLWVGGFLSKVFNIDRSFQHYKEFSSLLYQGEGQNKDHWFLGSDKEVVRYDATVDAWELLEDSENIIRTPVSLIVTERNEIVIAGSDNADMAVSVYKNGKWRKHIFKNVSYTSHYRALKQLHDGSIIVGASKIRRRRSEGHVGGMIQFRIGAKGEIANVKHLHRKNSGVSSGVSDIVQTHNSNIYFSQRWPYSFVDGKAKRLELPETFKTRSPSVMTWDGNNTLWFASFGYGLHSYSEGEWKFYPMKEYINTNSVAQVLPTPDGKVYVSTFSGVSYYDGETWIKQFLPDVFNMKRRGGTIKRDSENALWFTYSMSYWYDRINYAENKNYLGFPSNRSVRVVPDAMPPKIAITQYQDELAYDGRQFIAWKGFDKWNMTPEGDLLYSYKLNDEIWSDFVHRENITLDMLNDGIHTFEVRVKDSSGNIGADAAKISFRVLRPIWKQTWFIFLLSSLITAIVGLIIFMMREREKYLKTLEKVRLEALQDELGETRKSLSLLGLMNQYHHDIKAPLSIIDGVISTDIYDAQKQRDIVLEQVERGERLITTMASILRGKREREFKPVNIESIVKDSLFVFEKRFNKINYDLSHVPEIIGDPVDLKILFVNIIKNSSEAGDIRRELELNVKIWCDKNWVYVAIGDTGIGIDKDLLDNIWQIESSTKQKGNGIGLQAVSRIVAEHSGDVDVQSEMGVGTTFTFRFPFS